MENVEKQPENVSKNFSKNFQQGIFPGTEFIRRVEIIPNLFLCWSFSKNESNEYQFNIKPIITFEYYDAVNNPDELVELEPEYGPITHFKKFDESKEYGPDETPDIKYHHILGKYDHNNVGWTQLIVDSSGIKKYIFDGDYEMVRDILSKFLDKPND